VDITKATSASSLSNRVYRLNTWRHKYRH
jgi:hypothetical protein